MIKDGVMSVHDFDWIAQLRYYWEENGNSNRLDQVICLYIYHSSQQQMVYALTFCVNSFDTTSQKDVLVKMITTTVNYGYEYLGNSGRLVITPLTDRYFK